MNRTYKTVWNAKKGQLVVANETQKAKGKTGKTLTVLAVAAAALIGTVAQAAYVEQGKIGDVSSWETAEYQKDWGLGAMNASTAYALGFNGSGVMVGIMDSGALLQDHPDLAGDRFHATHVKGQYGSTGNRYPQSVSATTPGQPYEKGEEFEVTGNWIPNVNDNHGTHVVGTVGANRDGDGMHGVAWGADILSGNTGATDNNNYGPYQDHDYFYAGWKAMADTLVAANGADRGGVINNSWGTNIRTKEVYKWDANADNSNGTKGAWIWDHYVTPDEDTSVHKTGDVPALADRTDGMTYMQTGHLPANTVQESEYEYFYSNKVYGDKFAAGEANSNKSFVDAAWEAVKGTNVVQIFTTGNRNMANPFYRPLYPYFNPEAEQNWIAVAGLRKAADFDGTNHYELCDGWNEAGLGKYWTVAAPGSGVYSTIVGKNPNVTESTDPANPAFGKPGYANKSGTSMSAPHVAGAMGVLMSRYEDMTAIQVRDVMFTTANHYNTDGTVMKGWANVNGDVPLDGQVSDRMGWGVPDLDKGMFGPGQFLGKFDYNMANTQLDVWTNNISNVALDQRKEEDQKWLQNYDSALNADDLVLGNEFIVLNGTDDVKDHVVNKEDAKKWRKEYFEKRKAAIQAKLENGAYEGSLVKRGAGTLVMTGHNTYKGGTTVEGGTLLGFTESFGKNGGDVQVNGGKFGLLTSYYDELTQKGTLTSNEASPANVTVNNGGTLLITAGHDAVAGNIVFKEGAKISMTSDDLKSVYQGEDATATITAASIEGLDLAKADDTLAFFKTSFEAGTPETRAPGSTITATLTRNEDVTMSSIATADNGRAIGAALEAAGEGELFDAVLGGTTDQVAATYDSLGSDAFLNAQNASIVNTLTMTRAIQDQATGIGQGRAIDFADGTGRLWATGVGSWGSVDYGQTSIDNDFYAGFIGGEVKVADSSKVGVFFGAGTSEFKGGSHGKIKSNDVHFGIYGVSNIADLVAANYGITYTKQDRDMSRTLAFGSQTGANATSGNADILQLFAEGAYTGFNTALYSVEPYVGFNWLNVKADDFAETVGNTTFTTNNKTQNLQVTTLGIRGAVPFTVGNVAMTVKGNAGWSHFFGDTEAKATMGLGGSGFATIKGGELKDQANVGLGIEAQLSKSATFGFSYTGTYDGDVTASGVSANLRIAF